MKNIFIALIFTVLLSANSFSQDLEYMDYNWEESPEFNEVSNDTTFPVVVLKLFQSNEYSFDESGNNFFNYYLYHKKVKLLTHTGVEMYNKIYIPFDDEDNFLMIKARAINKDGKIIEMNKQDIKEGVDSETEQTYRFFAMDGVEVGSEVEYLYLRKKAPSLTGMIYGVQKEYPIRDFKADIISPQFLEFKAKSYNNLPEFKVDTIIENKLRWYCELDSIEGIKEQEQTAFDANLMYYAFKLYKNHSTGKKDLYSYGNISKALYESVYVIPDKKDNAAIKKIIKAIDIDKTNTESTIRSVENYIKTNYIFKEFSLAELEEPKSIIKSKVYNEIGAIRLFAGIFKKLGIKHELVLTCDRFDYRFDKDFELYTFLQEYLIYFPEIDMYMSPTNIFGRLGFPWFSYFNNYGLFIKEISMGDFNTGLGKVKFIETIDYKKSQDIIDISVKIPNDFTDTEYHLDRQMTGYNAYNYQPYYDFIKEEKDIKEFNEDIVRYIDKEGKIKSIEIENEGANNFGQKPFICKADVNAEGFFEKAGDKYLFKVGELIGPQMEMYEEENRTMNLEFYYNREYIRTIKFNIPEGYTMKNHEELELSEAYMLDNDTSMAFVSKVDVKDKEVTIYINEYYKEISYPVEVYNDYRRVMNAAANFNKKVIIFTKNE